MWTSIARFILRYRFILLLLIGLITLVMGYFSKNLEITNNFARSIPTDNPKYLEYINFKNKFGEDGNLLVIGVSSQKFFELPFFNAYRTLCDSLKKTEHVSDVLAVPTVINLIKDTASNRFLATSIFPKKINTQADLDSLRLGFERLLFYKNLVYNPSTNAYLIAIRIDAKIMNTPTRKEVVANIESLTHRFEKAQGVTFHYSGLPYLRTVIAQKVNSEFKMFLALSLLMTTIVLLFFFRSFEAVWLSMLTVLIAVIWSLGTLVLLGYKLTILLALVPPLIVVIGIPNCVYLLNKYHTEHNRGLSKMDALISVIDKMGVVTLFTNLTAAVGFGVFCFTKSAILKEFGVVTGINIVALFALSLVLIPSILSYLPEPKGRQTDYLDSRWMQKILDRLEQWAIHHRKSVYLISFIVFVIGIIGTLRLQSLGYIVDDLPKNDVVYLDLKYFEKNFGGVMPLEILIDTKKKRGANKPQLFSKLGQLDDTLATYPEFAKPLGLSQGIKFATQAFYNGDPTQYHIPESSFEQAFVYSAFIKKPDAGSQENKASKLIASFVDSTKQFTRVSINMQDVGSQRLPKLLAELEPKLNAIFDTSKYKVTLTGTSIVFQEGTQYIIHGLRDSLILAFITIVICMLFLFRSWRILLVSLMPNLLPLIVTAGIMGFMHIPLKPSTVLIFSISLGIAIDVTIRFLVNYKQELPNHNHDIAATVSTTVHQTGVSIIYTSLILFAGFFMFCASSFGGIVALGLLTSLTLLLSMIANLTLLPCLLMWFDAIEKK